MPHSGQAQRSYTETLLNTPHAMHLLLIVLFWQGVYTESTQPPQTANPDTSHSTSKTKVPVIKERDKPIVSYFGDTVVLDCQINYEPNTWQWYKANGTEKELLNTTESKKYHMEVEKNKTKLFVQNLTEEDIGKYVCRAVFNTSHTESHVELKVLSFMEPLKPFVAIAVEVVILVTLILLFERRSHSRQRDSETTENGPQSEQVTKLTQDESNGMDGATTRQRKVEQ